MSRKINQLIRCGMTVLGSLNSSFLSDISIYCLASLPIYQAYLSTFIEAIVYAYYSISTFISTKFRLLAT